MPRSPYRRLHWLPSAITRAWKTKFRSPHPSLPYPITLFIADSASAECSATTIGPQPDECRFFFLDNSRCCSAAHRCRGALRAATVATVLVECDGTARRPVATKVEANLHQASGLSVDRWKRPFLGRLDGEAPDIPAGTDSIRSGGEHRTVLVDDDSHPHFDMSS